jgi:uracil-DNA glycosylase
MAGQGYNFNNDKGRRIEVWLNAIRRDRNYARIVMGLPLIEPVRTEVRRTAERLGHRPTLTSLED